MNQTTKLILVMILASGALFSQQTSSAKQIVTFGVVRSSQLRLANSATSKYVAASISMKSLRSIRASVPAKITMTAMTSEKRSNVSDRTGLRNDVDTVEMDLQNFEAMQKPSANFSAPLLITVTE